MTPEQCRAARKLLGWTEKQLAEQAGTQAVTVSYVERGEGHPRTRTLVALQTALEAGGVEFIKANGVGPSVRLRKLDS